LRGKKGGRSDPPRPLSCFSHQDKGRKEGERGGGDRHSWEFLHSPRKEKKERGRKGSVGAFLHDHLLLKKKKETGSRWKDVLAQEKRRSPRKRKKEPSDLPFLAHREQGGR